MPRLLSTSLRGRLGAAPHRLDRLVLPVWIATRGLVVALVFLKSGGDVTLMQDVVYFREAARHIAATGTLPTTELWQYPPGAALVLVLPLLAGFAAYGAAFVLLMVTCDAAITRLLSAAGRRHGSRLGVWAWLLAMPWLREFSVLRFDLVPTLFAVAALLLLARRPAWFGVLAGLGALVKAWPVIVLAAEWNPRRLVVSAAAAAATVAAGVVLAWGLLGPQDAPLDNQAGRGLQAEAVAATPWHIQAIVEGRTVQQQFRSGAMEIVDPRADGLAEALTTATLAGMAILLGWWGARLVLLRRDPFGRAHLATAAAGVDFAFTCLLVALLTSRVLSPQFLVWVLGIAAVVLTFRDTRMRWPAGLAIAATVVTFGVLRYPETVVPRNVLVVAAAVAALVQLARSLRPRVATPATQRRAPAAADGRDTPVTH